MYRAFPIKRSVRASGQKSLLVSDDTRLSPKCAQGLKRRSRPRLSYAARLALAMLLVNARTCWDVARAGPEGGTMHGSVPNSFEAI